MPADYVALGSSYAAGPGIGERVSGSPLLCARSDANYAHVLARSLHLRLRDMTCSGATTANLLSVRQAGRPPQIEGLDAGVKLVTVTVGGNDVGYLGNLAGESCANARTRVPWLWRPVICRTMANGQVQQAFNALPGQLSTLVDQIRARAPHARILFVDYMTVLPARGSCFAAAPLTPSQITAANGVATRLSAITRAVAADKNTLFVAASQVTAGHDLCAKDPWLFGFQFNSIPLTWGPFAYHPNEKAMQAIATAVADTLRREEARSPPMPRKRTTQSTIG